jgi:hypothetical protein
VLDVGRWAELRREHFVGGVSIKELATPLDLSSRRAAMSSCGSRRWQVKLDGEPLAASRRSDAYSLRRVSARGGSERRSSRRALQPAFRFPRLISSNALLMSARLTCQVWT